MTKKQKIAAATIFVLLFGSNLFFVYKYYSDHRNQRLTEQKQQINSQILSFTQLFMAKVLRGGEVVSFDDRLQLENAVRALNDKVIFAAWEKFTKAKDQAEVQNDFYDLFEVLLEKIEE